MWVLLGGFSGLTLGLTDLASKIASREVGAISVLLASNIIGGVFIVSLCVFRGLFFEGELFYSTYSGALFCIGSLYLMYLSLPNIALSYAGAIRASGPIWTLLGAWPLRAQSTVFISVSESPLLDVPTAKILYPL